MKISVFEINSLTFTVYVIVDFPKFTTFMDYSPCLFHFFLFFFQILAYLLDILNRGGGLIIYSINSLRNDTCLYIVVRNPIGATRYDGPGTEWFRENNVYSDSYESNERVCGTSQGDANEPQSYHRPTDVWAS